ncbi:hypothetical protein HMPREF9120_00148 [Neisseria sp. oral taxon 020 str. F0370]|uniref:hypothetical protein n=1 Tax=unclassified Neisseria TaxID=2623750 RepID=UPI0002A46847|nr:MULTISPECIES: hypothetical protein [unclassified Neisseria]EKY10113.1 hypothetical protein HMPREF9120_00148 [Neisseria sp. oral taxon 020 str. F0370]
MSDSRIRPTPNYAKLPACLQQGDDEQAVACIPANRVCGSPHPPTYGQRKL